MSAKPQSMAFGAAIIQSLTVLAALPALDSQLALRTGLVAFLGIGLALGVRRGDRIAAWVLVAFQSLIVYSGYRTHSYGLLGVTVLFLALFLFGAIDLQRQPSINGDSWLHIVYELAFLQAAWTAIWVFLALMAGFFAEWFNAWNLVDVGILGGLGIAALKRRIWGAYGLVFYQIANTIATFFEGRPDLPEEVFTQVGIGLVYVLGAFRMRRLSHLRKGTS